MTVVWMAVVLNAGGLNGGGAECRWWCFDWMAVVLNGGVGVLTGWRW
jgi:hypothetical protein